MKSAIITLLIVVLAACVYNMSSRSASPVSLASDKETRPSAPVVPQPISPRLREAEKLEEAFAESKRIAHTDKFKAISLLESHNVDERFDPDLHQRITNILVELKQDTLTLESKAKLDEASAKLLAGISLATQDSKDECRPEKKASYTLFIECLAVCDQIIKKSPNHFGAYIVKASVLEHMCRYSDSSDVLNDVMDRCKSLKMPIGSDFLKECRVSTAKVSAFRKRDAAVKSLAVGVWYAQLTRDVRSANEAGECELKPDGTGIYSPVRDLTWRVLNGRLLLEGIDPGSGNYWYNHLEPSISGLTMVGVQEDPRLPVIYTRKSPLFIPPPPTGTFPEAPQPSPPSPESNRFRGRDAK